MSNVIIEALEAKLKTVEKAIKELNEKIYANPISDIISLRKKMQELKDEKGYDSLEFRKALSEAVVEEKRLYALGDWQNENTLKGIERLSQLELDKRDLINEIHFKKRR